MSGRPTSSNGASSLHLWWQLPASPPLVEVSAVLEIVTAPSVPALYFWAVQVGFGNQGRSFGAGHTGLQWSPDAPEGAVNWGGYGPDGRELEGTASSLPGVGGGVNTVHWAWHPGRPYRFRVSSDRPGWWQSEVSDLADGRRVIIRELSVPGTELTGPVVWSEVFARCDDPGTVARWSQLQGRCQDGSTVSPTALVTSYQAFADGGCSNTESRRDDADAESVLQITGLKQPRSGHPGQTLPYGGTRL